MYGKKTKQLKKKIKVSTYKKSLSAGPSDGKKSKVSPGIRATSGVNAAVPLPVPPYFLFPASHRQRFFNLFQNYYFYLKGFIFFPTCRY
jgi:hypothetical protein